MKTLSDLAQRLRVLQQRTEETPLFNPVFQLSLELSRLIESGRLTLADCHGLIAQLECEALQHRAQRLRELVGPAPAQAARPDLPGLGRDFDAFRALWDRPLMHVVFTAHPTFLLPPDQAAALAEAASSEQAIGEDLCLLPAERAAVTLADEHAQAMAALARAQDARDAIVTRLLEHAGATWPDRWQALRPLPFRFATWVGYDMDGRTDIGWAQSIGFRLAEKAERLARYVRALEAIDPSHALLSELGPSARYAAERAEDFAGDLDDPVRLSEAANRLTADDPHKLLSLAGLVERLEAEAADAPHGRAIQLKTLASAMRADGLGMGWIHFRVNAKQLHNALRRQLDPDETLDIASKGALAHLRKAIAAARPLRANFAALAIESSTAIRQFIAMAQILHHIDADAPIRMLVAECEEPTTVLAALYFARLFGIADKVDVSPLFETEHALEHGGRLLEALLAEPDYQAYARERGRVAVQTGFSDAGRFVGQVPAALAIERLQGRLAEAMAANGLTDVAALVFNTHGESMGRGAHPESMTQRLAWPLSPWARSRFVRGGIALEPEVSFQGGDGYLFFATPELASGTLARIAEAQVQLSSEAQNTNGGSGTNGGNGDPFYARTDVSLDFYRAVRDHQHAHLESRSYARAVTAFGLGLLNPTGSRVSRRQSDLSADREMNLRQIRAIPHNAVLQQLGYPVNVIAGIGSAADGRFEEIAELLANSARGQQILALVRAADALASVKTVAAYGELFNSAYWASRPYRGLEEHLAAPCEALAERLINDDRNGAFRRLASRLRVDALKLHRLLALIPPEHRGTGHPGPEREAGRRAIGVAQALRLALLQHMFIRAVSIPAFSRANDVSREDVLEMVFTLRIDDALAQLRRAYPVHFPKLGDFRIDEATDYPEGGDEGYERIHRAYIDPIEQAYRLSLRIGTAIANRFGAHG